MSESCLFHPLLRHNRSDCHHPIVDGGLLATSPQSPIIVSLYEGKNLDEYDLDDSFIDDAASEGDEEEEEEDSDEDEDVLEDVGEDISEEEAKMMKASRAKGVKKARK